MPTILYLILLLTRLLLPVLAQTVQSVLWNTPDGNAPDLSQTFTDGQVLATSWNGWSDGAWINGSASPVDLWVTSFDYNVNDYSQKLRSGINITMAGSYAWLINIPNEYLSISAKYVLRFMFPATSYDPNALQLSSPGFLVLMASSPSSGSASSAATRSAVSGPSTTTTAPALASPSAGLSFAAKAGIAAGIGLVGIAVISLAILLFQRRKQNPSFASALSYNWKVQGFPQSNNATNAINAANATNATNATNVARTVELSDIRRQNISPVELEDLRFTR